MFRKPFYILSIVIITILFGCTTIEYTNPLDMNGTQGNKLRSDPKLLADDDGDNVPNTVDPDFIPNKDSTPPTIILGGGDTIGILKGDTRNDYQKFRDLNNKSLVSATDKECGNKVTLVIFKDSVDVYTINTTGAYFITYKAIDCSGNSSYKTRYINVTNEVFKDTTPPSLVLIGDSLIEIALGGTFDDPGATAYDLGDSKNVPATVTGRVDSSKAGPYVLTYTAKDSKGNSISITRTVVVKPGLKIDLDPPIIKLNGKDTLTLAQGQTIEQFKATFVEPGYSASDSVDGDITKNVTVSQITYQNPSIYYIQYDVKDAAGNSAQTMYRYIKTGIAIIETYPPVIILVYGDSTIPVIKGTKWVEPGFAVTDVQDKTIPNSKVIVDSSNLIKNLDSLGTYIVKYTVANSLGLTTTKERKVMVVLSKNDRTKPVIKLLGRNPDTVLIQSKDYKDPGYTASDDRDGDVTAKVTRTGTIDFLHLGKNQLSYSVSDSAGNRSELTIRVIYVVPDTLTTDLFVRYNVPSPDTLPKIMGSYTTFDIDGDGPLAALKDKVTKIEFQWDAPNKQFQFYMTYNGPPNHVTLSTITQNFAQIKPQMNLVGSSIDGLDGKYYIALQGTKLVWVRVDKSFAVILSK